MLQGSWCSVSSVSVFREATIAACSARVRHLRKRIAHPVEVDDLLKRREEVAMPVGRGQFDVAERRDFELTLLLSAIVFRRNVRELAKTGNRWKRVDTL